MAMPIVVVKENPGTLVVEVREKRGRKEELVAVLKLPEVGAKLGNGAKVNGESVKAARHYRLEFAEAGRASKGKRKPKARKKSSK